MSKRQCKQIMSLSFKVNIWTRKRDVNHSGALRTPGDPEEAFNPRGPEDLTPTRENICSRCDVKHQVQVRLVKQLPSPYRLISLYIQASEVSDKMSELLIEMDSMDIEEEGKELDNSDKDSGLDSSDENYMNIEIFA